jgi:hypothetical protein
MIVRCVRILEGGRYNGRELPDAPPTSTIHGAVRVGGEYAVLTLSCTQIAGASYMVLRDGDPTAVAAPTASMFEIVSWNIPDSWVAHDPHGTGALIALTPEPWTEKGFWERKERGDRTALRSFRDEVRRIHSQEGRCVTLGALDGMEL